MKILWIPHAPLRTGRSRAEHFIEGLARRHEVRVLNFNTHPKSEIWKYIFDIFRNKEIRNGAGYDEVFLKRFPKLNALNAALLDHVIQNEVAIAGCEVIVLSPTPYLHGRVNFSRQKKRAPIVCDFIDGGSWDADADASAEFARTYVENSNATVCVSDPLFRQALTLNGHSYLIPNGVELSRYREFRADHSPASCKAALGIDPDSFVISIIGMTCSSRLYFVDAAMSLAKMGRKVTLLLVGNSTLLPEIKQRVGGMDDILKIVGQVPYEEIMPYFMASDVGLNVVDDTPYYHRQSPLKIFEYAAMGKPVVVAPRLDEVERNALSNVVFCEADAGSLTRCLAEIAANPNPIAEPDLTPYDWETLTAQFEDVLVQTRQRWLAMKAAD